MKSLDLLIPNIKWCHSPSGLTALKGVVLSVASKLYDAESLCVAQRAIFAPKHNGGSDSFGTAGRL